MINICAVLGSDQIVYDGVALLKSDSNILSRAFKSIKSAFSSKSQLSKEQELIRGMRAMLPNWSIEVQHAISIQQLVKWITDVKNRQLQVASRFRDKDDSAKRLVDQVNLYTYFFGSTHIAQAYCQKKFFGFFYYVGLPLPVQLFQTTLSCLFTSLKLVIAILS